ncbi:hypothetical protein ACIRL2_35705 [Embleya sp. NPDC127516]|uniref:hypothetical protein n=1 Tax=Embleya sp. NPDC127516 TaxID=3363990 RepID=UPI00381626EA
MVLRLLAPPARFASAVAARSRLSPAVIDALVVHPDNWVRRAVLDCGTATMADRVMFARDPHFGVRATLVAGPTRVGADHRRELLPERIITELAADPDDRVRWEVVTSPDLSPTAALLLSRDPDEAIRSALCRRGWGLLDEDSRGRLLEDAVQDVRLAALVARDRGIPGAARGLLDAGVEADDIARCCVLDTDTSMLVARHEDVIVRLAAAENPTLDPAAVARLATDEDVDVRFAVSLREELAEAERDAIDYTAALDGNPLFRPPAWIARAHGDPDTMRRCARSGHPWLRRCAARSAMLPPDVVALLAADPGEDVRFDLCCSNPDAPITCSWALCWPGSPAGKCSWARRRSSPGGCATSQTIRRLPPGPWWPGIRTRRHR